MTQPPKHRLMIISEHWTYGDEERQTSLDGETGTFLKEILQRFTVPWEDTLRTSVFKFVPQFRDYKELGGHKSEALEDFPPLGKVHVRKTYQKHLDLLHQEIRDYNPNCILALGPTVMWAICHVSGIRAHRGSPTLTHHKLGKYKVLPTYPPQMFWRNPSMQPVIYSDIKKAAKQSLFPELIRPARLIHTHPEISELWEFYERYLKDAPYISTDIETKLGTITEIGFSPDPYRSLVIPFYSREMGGGSYWKVPSEELEAWEFVRHVCANHKHEGQNFNYDTLYLLQTMGIHIGGIKDDSMILHHALYPELEKSLGFLGSLYTNEPSWKFMRKTDNTKTGS